MTLGAFTNSQNTCSHTSGAPVEGAEECGAPAVWHFIKIVDLASGEAHTMTSCDEHRDVAYQNCDDFHAFGPVREIPGFVWCSEEFQGEGRCIWPAAEEIEAAIAAEELLSTPTTVLERVNT